MKRTIATLGESGQLIFPPEISAALNLEPGSLWEIAIEDSALILTPLPETKHEDPLPLRVATLNGMFAEGPSLEDPQIEMRREEYAHGLRKELERGTYPKP